REILPPSCCGWVGKQQRRAIPKSVETLRPHLPESLDSLRDRQEEDRRAHFSRPLFRVRTWRRFRRADRRTFLHSPSQAVPRESKNENDFAWAVTDELTPTLCPASVAKERRSAHTGRE